MFVDYEFLRRFDNALIDFDRYFCDQEKSLEDLIFLVPTTIAQDIFGCKDVDYGEVLGKYKGVTIMCEQYNFGGLWVRHHDNVYYKSAEFYF